MRREIQVMIQRAPVVRRDGRAFRKKRELAGRLPSPPMDDQISDQEIAQSIQYWLKEAREQGVGLSKRTKTMLLKRLERLRG